jgi:sugar lactone lactonase YvrE
VRLTPGGDVDCVVAVAASQVTSCTFGDPDLTALYITTAAGGLSPAGLRAEPHAGGLFRVDPDVGGAAARHLPGVDAGQ